MRTAGQQALPRLCSTAIDWHHLPLTAPVRHLLSDAGVYASTELYMLTDYSPGYQVGSAHNPGRSASCSHPPPPQCSCPQRSYTAARCLVHCAPMRAHAQPNPRRTTREDALVQDLHPNP